MHIEVSFDGAVRITPGVVIESGSPISLIKGRLNNKEIEKIVEGAIAQGAISRERLRELAKDPEPPVDCVGEPGTVEAAT